MQNSFLYAGIPKLKEGGGGFSLSFDFNMSLVYSCIFFVISSFSICDWYEVLGKKKKIVLKQEQKCTKGSKNIYHLSTCKNGESLYNCA